MDVIIEKFSALELKPSNTIFENKVSTELILLKQKLRNYEKTKNGFEYRLAKCCTNLF